MPDGNHSERADERALKDRQQEAETRLLQCPGSTRIQPRYELTNCRALRPHGFVIDVVGLETANFPPIGVGAMKQRVADLACVTPLEEPGRILPRFRRELFVVANVD